MSITVNDDTDDTICTTEEDINLNHLFNESHVLLI